MLMHIEEAAKLLQVRPARVYALIRQGKIPVVRLGPRQLRIDPNKLQEALTQLT